MNDVGRAKVTMETNMSSYYRRKNKLNTTIYMNMFKHRAYMKLYNT